MDKFIINYKDKNKTMYSRIKDLQDRAKKIILSNEFQYVKITKDQFDILNNLLSAKASKDIDLYKWNTGVIHNTVNELKENVKEIEKRNM